MTTQFSSRLTARAGLLIAIVLLSGSTTFGQVRPTAARNKELSKLDAKASKVDDVFLRNAFEMAAEYEKAGDIARAVDYLHAMSLVKPGLPKIEGKLSQLRKQVLAANDFNFKFTPTANWGQPVGFVKSGKPFQVAVEGGYKLSINTTVGPDGLAEDDEKMGLIKDTPIGKIVGVIIENPNQKDRKKNRLKPFEIGTGRIVNPNQTGFLFLKANLPPESKTGGALQVRLSGYVLAPNGQNVGN